MRHKLQKGLLTRDQEPKAEEMKLMSDYVAKLEGFPDLEVSIIRATKINKVLKAILKLASIPKEEEFQFKPRSQTLLDKWNKLLAVDPGPASTEPTTGTNGVNGKSADAKEESPSDEKAGSANGVQENGLGKSEAPAADETEPAEPSEASDAKKETPPAEEVCPSLPLASPWPKN